MMVKLIISLIIIGCSSLIGNIYANAFVERTKLLASTVSTLQMMETEIVYSATPLPLLLEKVSKKSKKEIASIFENASIKLKKKEGYLFIEAWRSSVEEGTKGTAFTKEDVDLLIALGNTLGISDSEDQVKHIRLTMEEMKRNYEMSILDQKKNVKLYRSLGFLMGITVVILFF